MLKKYINNLCVGCLVIMDRNLIEKYSRELLDIYKKSKQEIKQSAVMTATIGYSENTGRGGLQVIVTTIKGLYPLKGATVTIFKGPYEQMQVIDRALTDESGKTKVFNLEAPPKSLSESAGSQVRPYANYNISISADGFLEQVNMNVPVFDGVVSLQNADLILNSAAGKDGKPRFFDETEDYNL